MMRVRFQLPEDIETQSPVYKLPYGAVWQQRAHELLEDHEQDNARYLVRPLKQAPSALVAGAVLRHSSALEHPRCWGPNFWMKHNDGQLWMATIRPLGEPLMNVPRSRQWSEAVELWRPLAEAIRRAHQRGVVHGMITPWTTWYDEEAERLTTIDAGCWVGDALPHDSQHHVFIAPELRVDPALRSPTLLCNVYALAKLLIYLIDPKAFSEHSDVLEEIHNLSEIPQEIIPALQRALADDPAQRLPMLEDLLVATSQSIATTYDTQMDVSGEPQITTILGARITHKEPINHPKMGPGLKFYLNLKKSHTDAPPIVEEDAIGAFFYEGADKGLHDSIQWAWDGAQCNLIDARLITDSKGRHFVTSHTETLPVLEPNFPVSVSNVLKAERCTSRFLVDERDSGKSSRALVLGNLVHGLLEDLTAPNPPTFEACFQARSSKMRVEMLAAGLSQDDMQALERDARQHYTNLERFTSARQQSKKAPPARLAPSPRWPTEETVYDREPHHDMGWSGRHIEVTRYSPLYGLEGRIDLATEDDQEGIQIIELKSGSAWDGHLSQVRCYTLLWDGMAQSHGTEVSGYVLYSRYGRLNAVPMEDISRERRILRARNELVACQRSFIDPAFQYTPPHFMQEPRHCNSPSCKFRRDRCQEQTSLLGLDPEHTPEQATKTMWNGFPTTLVTTAWAYWKHYDRMIEMERWAQQSALGMLFDRSRIQERVELKQACENMRLTHYDVEKNLLTFQGKGAHIFHKKSAVLIHRGDLHYGATLQGYVEDSGAHFVTLKSQGTQSAITLDPDGWILDQLPTRMGIRQAKQSLYKFIQNRDSDLLHALLQPETATHLFEPSEQRREQLLRKKQSADIPFRLRSSTGLPSMNARQREAMDYALNAPRGALIQGPPGTGKTTVIAQIVRELVSCGERVLVCAQTNTAVDTILSKVLDAGVRAFLRVGDMDRSPQLTHSLELEGYEPHLFFTRSLARETDSLDELSNALTTCPVYGSTTHSAVRDPVFEFLSSYYGDPLFDVVIVDEASQLTEPMTLAAINHAKRFVLVGDHRQLPPIVQSEQALTSYYLPGFDEEIQDEQFIQTDEPLPEPHDPFQAHTPFKLPKRLLNIGCAGLDRSLFERLVTQLPHVMLEEQYRMHSSIMAYSNRLFYKGKLSPHKTVASHQLNFKPDFLEAQEGWIQDIFNPTTPVCFVNIAGEDFGRTNEAEAQALVKSVKLLLDEDAFMTGGQYGPRPSIGIISPFKAQGQRIRELLLEELDDLAWLVDVDTVERYQGGERDIILVSMVKTERAGDFLSDMRRLNVTLTRARKKLIVFGHKTCLELNPRLRILITQAETKLISPVEPSRVD